MTTETKHILYISNTPFTQDLWLRSKGQYIAVKIIDTISEKEQRLIELLSEFPNRETLLDLMRLIHVILNYMNAVAEPDDPYPENRVFLNIGAAAIILAPILIKSGLRVFTEYRGDIVEIEGS
jgi:hypothetical protein